MTAAPSWTPASRPGLIPLHPLSFGTILGRSFAALRQNPRVLLGFALVVQTVAYLLLLVGTGAVGLVTFSRLETLLPGSDDFNAVLAGSIAITATTGVVLGLASGALNVIIQGIVVTEVAHAAVAEKRPLRALWAQLRPVVWRLLGYALLIAMSVLAVVGVLAAIAIAVGFVLLPLGIVLGVLFLFAAIPVSVWLGVKLVLVPATIILEHARIPDAVSRSWQLTRGRFWSTWGVLVVIGLGFSIVAQVVSFPFSILGSGIGGVIAPTGDDDATAVIALVVTSGLTQIVTLLIQAVALVVQATAVSLVYIDCRMRHEGLDLDLLAYVEQRDAGVANLPDPYRVHAGRAMPARPPVGYPVPPPGAGPYPPYAPTQYPPYPPAQYPPSPAAQYPPDAPPQHPPAAPASYPPAPAPHPPAPQPSADVHPPTQWTAPGTPTDEEPR